MPDKVPMPKAAQLDPTYLEQTGLDPQQVWKSINTETKRQTSQQQPRQNQPQAPQPPPRSQPQSNSAKDLASKLDPTAIWNNNTNVEDVYRQMKANQLRAWTSGGSPGSTGGGSGSTRSPGQPNISPPPPPSEKLIPVDYLLGPRNPENMLKNLQIAIQQYQEQLNKTIEKHANVVKLSGNKVDMSDKLKEMVDRYKAALDELKRTQNLEETLKRKYGNNVVISRDGDKVAVDLAPNLKSTIQKVNSFASKYNTIMQSYKAAVSDLAKRYDLNFDQDGRLLITDPHKYSKVMAELDAINSKYGNMLDNLFGRYRDLFNVRVVDGRQVYEFKPEVQAALVLQQDLEETTSTLNQSAQLKVQDILNRYGDVLTYDPNTRTIKPSSTFATMLNEYNTAVAEISKISDMLSRLGGMAQTVAQQAPIFTVELYAYNKGSNEFVKTGIMQPVHIADPKKREEVLSWLSRQNKDDVVVFAPYDPNKPWVYMYNKHTGEGYMINTATGRVLYSPNAAKDFAEGHGQALWHRALTPEERRKLEEYHKMLAQKEETKQWLLNLPPLVRNAAGGFIALSQYAMISPAVEVLVRTLRGDEDPLAGLKKQHAMLEAVREVTPGAYYAATAGGAAALFGLGVESLLARGAAKLGLQSAKDAAKYAAIKTPAPTTTAQLLDALRSSPTLKAIAVGLKDAAVPMTLGAAAFGGIEGVKSYLETGRVDASRALTGAAFGSLIGAFPITRAQALAGLGIGAGAAAGSHFIRGYDLPTSLTVGESAGQLALIIPGLWGLSSAKTPNVGAPGADIITVKPRWRTAPSADLPSTDFAKKLHSAIGNTVADLISGRITVEEANLRLGAFRDAVSDKALFDRILQSYKTLLEPPKMTPKLDFAAAASRAAKLVQAADSGSMPGHRAFIELADLRASVANKARFDRIFGSKLKEYGEHYIQWIVNSGLDKPSAVLQLARYEGVLGRQFIEKYVPDYGKVLADIEAKLSQLRPVSPREAPAVKPTPEDVYARVRSLFDDVVEGRMDWFRASEELYKIWRDASPDVRADLEVALNVLNKLYGEKYGVTLEPWRPSLLEAALRKAELFATDIRTAVRSIEEFLDPRRLASRWRYARTSMLDDELHNIADLFIGRRKIGLDEAKRMLADLANKYEKLGMEEMSKTIREKLKDDEALKRFLEAALGMHRMSAVRGTLELAVKPHFGRAKDVVDAFKEFVPEHHRYTLRGWRLAEIDAKFNDIISRLMYGEISPEAAKRRALKLVGKIEKMYGREVAEGYRKHFDLAVLRKEFDDVIAKFRRGEINLDEAKKRLMEIADEIERKVDKEKADLYRNYAEEALTGKHIKPAADEKPHLPDENMSEKIRRMMLEAELSRRGFEFSSVVNRFRLGEISRRDAKRRLLQIVEEIEKLSDQLGDRRWAKLYNKKYVKEVLSGRRLATSSSMSGRVVREKKSGQQLLLLKEEAKTVKTGVPGMRRNEVPEKSKIRIRAVRTAAGRMPKTGHIATQAAGLKPAKKVKRRTVAPLMPLSVSAYQMQELSSPTGVPAPRLEYMRTGAVEAVHHYIPATTHAPIQTQGTDAVPITTQRVPTLDMVWVPTPTVKPIPAPEPAPLPPWWWRFVPPDLFGVGGRQGAYRVQSGRKQVLALA